MKSLMKKFWLFIRILLVAALTTACGGGGSGGTEASNGTPATSPVLETTNPPPSGGDKPIAYKTPFPYIDVLHTRVVHDPTRRLLYAYVPPADPAHPGSFAIIDVDQRSVSFSAPVDFVPFNMTVSPNGEYLYVATAHTNEVVRLTLPGFGVDMRVTLGADPSAPLSTMGNEPFDGGHVAVSPTDPETFAVSLINNQYWTCAIGVRVYKNTTTITQLYNTVDTSVGDMLAFNENGDAITTLCSGTQPDIVSRLTFNGTTLNIIDSQRGAAHSNSSFSLDIQSTALITGSGTVIDLPALGLRGSLVPLTLYQQGDPASLLHGCVFADATGNYAACLAQTDLSDGFPTTRAFVIYELTNAQPVLAVPLDLPMSRGTSRIFRTGDEEFAVSVGANTNNPVWLSSSHYMHQNTRIYFLK